MTENTFTQFMRDNYSHNELADIANQGCTGGVSGMIYYRDTENLYNEHQEALHAILNEYKDATGEWPSYVIDDLGDCVRFMNSVVWFCAEWVAYELTQGEYIKEEA